MNRKFFILLAVLFLVTLSPRVALADNQCLLIVSYPDNKTLHEDGNCDRRVSPASTFKIPLAVIGFDWGYLKDAHTPSIPYNDAYAAEMELHRQTTDPTSWLQNSVVWYSQKMTRAMGRDMFADYLTRLHYGNMDISGMPPVYDGLTHAWLSTSLKISPREQVDFLRRLLNHDLDVQASAQDKTIAIMPEFSAHGWRIRGKTGSGYDRDLVGVSQKNRPFGWFVGWAEKSDRTIIFAYRISGREIWNGYGGPRARDAFLKMLPSLKLD
jgi:beta-lactamase class D